MWRLCRPLPGFDADDVTGASSLPPAPAFPATGASRRSGPSVFAFKIFIPLLPAPSLHRCRAWVRETDDAEMSSSSGFNDEKGGSSSVGEPEYGHDPASGGIFSSDYKRYRSAFTPQRITVGVNAVDARDFYSFSSRGWGWYRGTAAPQTSLCLPLGRDWERWCPLSGGDSVSHRDLIASVCRNGGLALIWSGSVRASHRCVSKHWRGFRCCRGCVFVWWSAKNKALNTRDAGASSPDFGAFQHHPYWTARWAAAANNRKCWGCLTAAQLASIRRKNNTRTRTLQRYISG